MFAYAIERYGSPEKARKALGYRKPATSDEQDVKTDLSVATAVRMIAEFGMSWSEAYPVARSAQRYAAFIIASTKET